MRQRDDDVDVLTTTCDWFESHILAGSAVIGSGVGVV